MNINKFTQKSMQAVQDCEKLAYQYGNQEIDQEHLIVALLHQEDSLFAKLITSLNILKTEQFRHLKKRLRCLVETDSFMSAMH